MAIKGKKEYKFYLTEENAELVKDFLEKGRGRGGFSALMDELIAHLANVLRESGIGKRPLNYAKVVRMFIAGFKEGSKI